MRQKLARTSAAAGKTRQANIFQITVAGGLGHPGAWSAYLVDLPGYGYARGGRESVTELAAVVAAYFAAGRRPVPEGAGSAKPRRGGSSCWSIRGILAWPPTSRPISGSRRMPRCRTSSRRRSTSFRAPSARGTFARSPAVRPGAVGGVERHGRRPRRPAASDGQSGQGCQHLTGRAASPSPEISESSLDNTPTPRSVARQGGDTSDSPAGRCGFGHPAIRPAVRRLIGPTQIDRIETPRISSTHLVATTSGASVRQASPPQTMNSVVWMMRSETR